MRLPYVTGFYSAVDLLFKARLYPGKSEGRLGNIITPNLASTRVTVWKNVRIFREIDVHGYK